MANQVDRAIRDLAQKLIASGWSRRGADVLRVMLEKGWISTDDINDLGYNHPPRAVGDVRDAGIPVITGKGTSRTGRRMAVYALGVAADIQEGRVGGRSAFPKKFKAELIRRYGSIDCITGAKLDERVLQIDHRIPYRIGGDAGLSDHDVEAFMLLDGSSQRAKSWSCESCPNMQPEARVVSTCKSCFWSFPENYEHIATEQIRRTDLVWQGDDVDVYDRLRGLAGISGLSVGEYLLQLARAKVKIP
ncbi:hypothetical protein [Caulobacter sp. LjRoot300]|uniref:hypothetical protein n=1 Tax=Caulobacter sp. LjRoot300 TaxID=3342321 RepID=UPI003ECFD6FF